MSCVAVVKFLKLNDNHGLKDSGLSLVIGVSCGGSHGTGLGGWVEKIAGTKYTMD